MRRITASERCCSTIAFVPAALLSQVIGGEGSGLAQFDPYAILGIDDGVDAKGIKRAYRSLSLQVL